MFDAKVITNYTVGTIIELDANDALNFLVGLSITVINTVRDTIKEISDTGDIVNTKSCDHDVMDLIEHYNSGIPGAIYSGILQTNADILLEFVGDVVLNESARGLYLFYHRSNRRNGKAPYDLIVKALEEVHQYYLMYGNDNYKISRKNWFNRYNEDFLKLINGN